MIYAYVKFVGYRMVFLERKEENHLLESGVYGDQHFDQNFKKILEIGCSLEYVGSYIYGYFTIVSTLMDSKFECCQLR